MKDYFVLGGWDGINAQGMLGFFQRMPWGYFPLTMMDFHPFEFRNFFLSYLQGKTRSIYNQISEDASKPLNYKVGNYTTYTSQENNWVFNNFFRGSFDLLNEQVDLSLGQYKPEAVASKYANYFHFPVYIVNLFNQFGAVTLAELKQYLEQFEQGKLKAVGERPALFCQIARHDELLGLKGVRSQIIDAIQERFSNVLVACPGEFRHNTEELWQDFNNDKIAYLQRFIFNICPENSYSPGYVTEKIWDSIRAGCLPIYWGGIESDLDIFNDKGILFFDPRKPQALVEQLTKFVTDPKYQQELIGQSYFKPGAAERIWLRYFYPVLKRFEQDQGLGNIYQYRSRFVEETTDFILEDCATSLEQEFAQATANLAALGLTETRYAHLSSQQYRFPFTQEQRIQLVSWQLRQTKLWRHFLEQFKTSLVLDEQGKVLQAHSGIGMMLRTRYQFTYYEQLRLLNKDLSSFPVNVPSLGYRFELSEAELRVEGKDSPYNSELSSQHLREYLLTEKEIRLYNEQLTEELVANLQFETTVWSEAQATQIKNPLQEKYPNLLMISQWYQAKAEVEAKGVERTNLSSQPELVRTELVPPAEAADGLALSQALEQGTLSMAQFQKQLTAHYAEVTTTLNPAAQAEVAEDDLYGYLYMDQTPQVAYGVPRD